MTTDEADGRETGQTLEAARTEPAARETVPLGAMIAPFPQPGPLIEDLINKLMDATINPPATEDELRRVTALPRPWDPGSCTSTERAELWPWLDQFASWLNHQHLWNLNRPGIPECWPEHPHLIHDLAVLACTRFFACYAVTPNPLEDWHTHHLAAFLDRLRDRLGDACQPGKHHDRPRRERDQRHDSTEAHLLRQQRFDADAQHGDYLQIVQQLLARAGQVDSSA